MAHKMIKALVRDLDDQGFQVTRTRGNHFEVRKAEGDFVMVLPSTASEGWGRLMPCPTSAGPGTSTRSARSSRSATRADCPPPGPVFHPEGGAVFVLGAAVGRGRVRDCAVPAGPTAT
jgi:predicted RNA binding protein YcfA (HicA-like mRNA interferase family)